MRQIPHFINGAIKAGTSGRVSDVFDPNRGVVAAQVQLADASELDVAVQVAAADRKSVV